MEGWENAPPGSNTPLGGAGTCCSHPKHQHHTRAAQNLANAFPASEQEGVCSRYQCPRKKAREDRKRALDPNLNEESKTEAGVSFSSAQVADDRDGCRGLDEGSSHFQLNFSGPSWPLCRHQRCSCCPSDVAGPGSSPQDGGASTPEWEMLVVLSGGSLSPPHLGLSTLQP